MNIEYLKEIIKSYKYYTGCSSITHKLEWFTNFHDERSENSATLTTNDLYLLITTIDLFHEDHTLKKNISRKAEELIRNLQNEIVKVIAPWVESKNAIEQINLALTHLRKEELLTESHFKTLVDKDVLAITIIDAMIQLHAAKMSISRYLVSILAVFDQIKLKEANYITTGMEILNHEKSLNKANLDILLHHPTHAIPLAEGITFLYHASSSIYMFNLASRENITLLIKHAEHAPLLANGLVKLAKHHIDNHFCRDALADNPREAVLLANIYCALHSKDPSKNLLTHENSMVLLQQDKALLLCLSQMIAKLKDKHLLTQDSLDKMLEICGKTADEIKDRENNLRQFIDVLIKQYSTSPTFFATTVPASGSCSTPSSSVPVMPACF